jgi:hypothetical protein
MGVAGMGEASVFAARYVASGGWWMLTVRSSGDSTAV